LDRRPDHDDGDPADRQEAAVGHLEDALATNMRAQAPPWVARTLLDLARALLARNGPGDADRALGSLQRAQVLASELGMRSLAEQVMRER